MTGIRGQALPLPWGDGLGSSGSLLPLSNPRRDKFFGNAFTYKKTQADQLFVRRVKEV